MQRNTKQKNAIRNVFLKYNRPLRVQEIQEYGKKEVGTLNSGNGLQELGTSA